MAGRAFDRCFHPPGPARQLVAITASGNRRKGLRELRIPTVVIHGVDDPLVPVECGRDTAACVPGAELVEISGMGHDMPRAVWPRVLDAVAAVAARVG
jgi:pimeloyl-ACP methyl ester carboxylesterase